MNKSMILKDSTKVVQWNKILIFGLSNGRFYHDNE